MLNQQLSKDVFIPEATINANLQSRPAQGSCCTALTDPAPPSRTVACFVCISFDHLVHFIYTQFTNP